MATGRPSGRPRGGTKTDGQGTAPTPPKDFTDAHKAVWRKLWKSSSQLKPEDAFIIERLSKNWVELAVLETETQATGFIKTIEMTNGAMTMHPYYARIDKLDVMINARLASLAFSPSDRARLKLETDEIVDDAVERMEASFGRLTQEYMAMAKELQDD